MTAPRDHIADEFIAAMQRGLQLWLDSGAWRRKPRLTWPDVLPIPNTNYHPMTTPDIVSTTIAERGRVYGEPHLSHENIGLAWTGLIQQHYGIRLDHPLPHWLVEQMLAAFKIHRAAKVFHEDNYVDAVAYLRFARHGQERPSEPYTP